MNRSHRTVRALFATQLILAAFAASLGAQQTRGYFPPRGEWQRKSPAEVGMDSAKLRAAVEFAQSRNSTWDFDKDQVRTFGRPLGPLPKTAVGDERHHPPPRLHRRVVRRHEDQRARVQRREELSVDGRGGRGAKAG